MDQVRAALWATPEHVEFMRDRMTGDKNPFFGKTHTEEAKLIFATTAAERCRVLRLGQRPTRLELTLYAVLEAAGVEFEREVRFGRYVVDAYCPHSHVAFEADGVHWHDAEKDAQRDAWLMENHKLPVLRFSEQRLKEVEPLLA